MATLNFIDVLTAPEFIDTASMVRTTRVIGTNGRAVDTVAGPISFNAIITSDGADLQRLPDGSRLGGAIQIFTQTWLTGGLKIDDVNSVEADIVTWHGRQYVVKAVQDWDAFASMGGGFINFGAPVGGNLQGYFVVSCDLLPLNSGLGV
jgi:hypothetical protein